MIKEFRTIILLTCTLHVTSIKEVHVRRYFVLAFCPEQNVARHSPLYYIDSLLFYEKCLHKKHTYLLKFWAIARVFILWFKKRLNNAGVPGYLLVMSPSRAGSSHGSSWRIFGSARDLFHFSSDAKSAKNEPKIGRKWAKIRFSVEDLFFY